MPTTSVPFFNSFVIGIPMCLAEANDDEGAPNCRQRLNDFLTLFTLGSRAGLEPVLIKTGITERGSRNLVSDLSGQMGVTDLIESAGK